MRIINITIALLLAAAGFGALALAGTWCYAALHFIHNVPDFAHVALDVALAAACGSVLLWLAWKIVKRGAAS